MSGPIVCFVISSIGTTDRLEQCAASLDALLGDEHVVGFCDQSADGTAADRFRSRYTGPFFVTTSTPGLSAGRNSVILEAPADVTHFAFLNDSSTVDSGFVRDLRERHADADVVVAAYEDVPGQPRYRFDSGDDRLDRFNCWKVLEPAMMLSRRALDDAGLFDESIGTGSRGPQSGEGTDLLLRFIAARQDEPQHVQWDPEMIVHGVRQGYGLDRRVQLRKNYRYAVGYGFLLSKWNYPWWFRMRALAAPMRFAFTGGGRAALMDGLATGAGRIAGLRHARHDRNGSHAEAR